MQAEVGERSSTHIHHTTPRLPSPFLFSAPTFLEPTNDVTVSIWIYTIYTIHTVYTIYTVYTIIRLTCW